jgi:hypothetical protein
MVFYLICIKQVHYSTYILKHKRCKFNKHLLQNR